MRASTYQKLDTGLRDAFAAHLQGRGRTKKKGMVRIQRMRVPNAGVIDLFIAPRSGVTAMLVQRSDHLATYKHLVGQSIGVVAHLHRMEPAQLQRVLHKLTLPRGVDAHDLSKRIVKDLGDGKLAIAIVTEAPSITQVEQQLANSFQPVLRLLQAWMVTPVRKKKMCSEVKAFSVDLGSQPPKVKLLFGARKK